MPRRARILQDLLWITLLFGAAAIGFRLAYGLGATTNLTDELPWGLWKILNMVTGVALATGGFTVGLLVYVLGLERLRALVKPAILVAFLGYGSSVFALVLDIGLPHRIWHPFLMWNPHSFLFEVAMCVAFYFTVTIVELAPTALETTSRWRRAASWLHRLTPAVVIVGITLSSLHHTSLGSLFLVTPTRLHPLWYTSWLPLLFIVSAMGAGMMVVVLVWMFWAWLFHPTPVFGTSKHRWAPQNGGAAADDSVGRDLPMLRLLASLAAGVLAFYLALKLVDLVRTGAYSALAPNDLESWLWVVELLLASIVPLLLLSVPSWRRTAVGIAAAAFSGAAGVVLNRLSVGIFGYFQNAGESYWPTLTEWAISLFAFAGAGLILLWLGRRFSVFGSARRDEVPDDPASLAARLRERGDPAGVTSQLERVLLFGVAVVPLAWFVLYPPFADARSSVRVAEARGADSARSILVLDANQRRLEVVFPHGAHRERAERDGSCGRCHHLALPGDNATSCSRCHAHVWSTTEIFDHEAHHAAIARREGLGGTHPSNRSCRSCHEEGASHTGSGTKACAECHREDMRPAREISAPLGLREACGYLPALHGTCLDCHREKAEALDRPELAECARCHAGTTTADDDYGQASLVRSLASLAKP